MNDTFRRVIILAVVILSFISLNCSKQEKYEGFSTLRFKIIDIDSNEPIPGKLIFIRSNGAQSNLQISKSFGLAPEDNGVYTAFGNGEVDIPAGEYLIYASRGMEYSIDNKKIRFDPNTTVTESWFIKHEFDPKGFVGCDFHFHTTNSDGHCTEEERVTSLVGEGVEFSVPADHNYVTDLNPAVQTLGVSRYLATMPGEEFTTEVGHYNVFPLPANTQPFDWHTPDSRIHFGYVRAIPGPLILQVNHPRADGLDYFGIKGIDPMTGDTVDPSFSWDFDAVEIMNEPSGWGYFTGPNNRLSVWEDWVNFLNKDFRVTGMGNSDSHDLIANPVGTPRNYIASNTDDPSLIDALVISKNIRSHRVSVARGVFVNLAVNQRWPIGSEVIDTDGTVELTVEVQSPSWARAQVVTVFGNGRVVWSSTIRVGQGPVVYKKKIKLHPQIDTWYVVRAEGDDDMSPIIPQHQIKITPLGFSNPIWVDVDGNGFECERDRARRFFREFKNDISEFTANLVKTDMIFQKQLYALIDKNSDIELAILKTWLFSENSVARKTSYRRLSEIGDADSKGMLQNAKDRIKEKRDKILIETYLVKLDGCKRLFDFMPKVVSNDDPMLRADQVKILSSQHLKTDWMAVGPFDNDNDKGLSTPYGPEKGVTLADQYDGKGGVRIGWQTAIASESGFVDLAHTYNDYGLNVGYAFGKVISPKDFKTFLLFGSDDGAAIWQNGQEIYRRFVRRGANPGDEIIPIVLQQGENTFLVKVENVGSDMGFYFEIMDPCHVLPQ